MGDAVAGEGVGVDPGPWKPHSHCPIQELVCGGGRGWVCQHGEGECWEGEDSLIQDISLKNSYSIAFSTCKLPDSTCNVPAAPPRQVSVPSPRGTAEDAVPTPQWFAQQRSRGSCLLSAAQRVQD